MTDAPDRFFVTDTELVQLLGMTPGDPAATSARALGLADHLENADLRRAGIQSLLVRGLATLTDGDRLDAVGPAQVVGAVLGRATDWLAFAVEGPNVRARTVLASAPVGAVTIALGPVGVHEVAPLRPDIPLTEPLKLLIDAYAANDAMERPLEVRVRRSQGADADDVLFTIDADGTWSMPRGRLLTHTGTAAEVWPHVLAAVAEPQA
ncbi:hypothetical protein [Propioniciclava soli]|uniref:hypothetical protein n=1 Tax=Propioniciclava soli TaxID=2775081 RepID=UPI001E51E092|nr:hypothetical protein [Propioniciclava soli]